PKCITEVMTDPAKAREAAATAKNNDELKTIVDADQAARNVKMTPDNLKKMGQEDKARSARVREIIAKGDLHTAQDFAAASLVLQHGDVYASYALAHELSLCALLLGDKNSAWLLAATYDRMLNASGHDQRFGTQYRGISAAKLTEVDTVGINDTERTAMHCPTLEKARTRTL